MRTGWAPLVGAVMVLVSCGSGASESQPSVGPPVTEPPDTSPVVTRDVDVAGRTTADVFAPEGAEDLPVIVLFHGTDGLRERMEPLAVDLAASGAVVVVPSWPVIPTLADLDETGGDYLEQTAVAVCSVRFARAVATEYGGDPDDLTVLGHSGGAPLGARVALVEEPPWPGIDCYPGFDAPVDRFVGTSGDFTNEYQYAPFAAETHRPYDVLELAVTNTDLEVRVFHGIADTSVESFVPAAFAERMDAEGVRNRLLYVDGKHRDLVEPSSPVGRFVADQIDAFVHGRSPVDDDQHRDATLTFDASGCGVVGATAVAVDRSLHLDLVNETSVPVWFSLAGYVPELTDAEVASILSGGPRDIRNPPDGFDVYTFIRVEAGTEGDMDVVFVRDAHRWIAYCMPEGQSGHPQAEMMIPAAEIVLEPSSTAGPD